MNSTILGKARLWTLVSAFVIAAGLVPLADARFALGFLGSAVWAVLSFWLVEALVRRALLPREAGRDKRVIAGLVAAKFALYATATWVLIEGHAPAMSCIYGVSLILIVLVITVMVIRPSLAPQRLPERGTDD